MEEDELLVSIHYFILRMEYVEIVCAGLGIRK